MDWTEAEEAIIANIILTESQLAPGLADARISCTRPEALRRLVRRTRHGEYRLPTRAMVVNLLPPTPKREVSEEQRDAFKSRVAKIRQTQEPALVQNSTASTPHPEKMRAQGPGQTRASRQSAGARRASHSTASRVEKTPSGEKVVLTMGIHLRSTERGVKQPDPTPESQPSFLLHPGLDHQFSDIPGHEEESSERE